MKRILGGFVLLLVGTFILGVSGISTYFAYKCYQHDGFTRGALSVPVRSLFTPIKLGQSTLHPGQDVCLLPGNVPAVVASQTGDQVTVWIEDLQTGGLRKQTVDFYLVLVSRDATP